MKALSKSSTPRLQVLFIQKVRAFSVYVRENLKVREGNPAYTYCPLVNTLALYTQFRLKINSSFLGTWMKNTERNLYRTLSVHLVYKVIQIFVGQAVLTLYLLYNICWETLNSAQRLKSGKPDHVKNRDLKKIFKMPIPPLI